MTPRPRRDGEAGLTLVEMLVALAIFALVGLASFATLDTIIRVRDRTEGRLERVADLDRALMILGRDLAQSRPGGIEADATGLRIVGVAGTMTYAFGDGVLTRSVGEGAPLEQVVATNLADAGWRMLGAEGWSAIWPPQDAVVVLRAVEVTLSPEPGQTARRLVEIAQEPAR